MVMQEFRDSDVVCLSHSYDKSCPICEYQGEIGRRDTKRSIRSAKGHELIRQVKIGRNEPCPCGSRKKFKKCCIDQVDVFRDKIPTDTLYPNQTDEFTELMRLAKRSGWTVPVNTAHRMESWICYWQAMIKHKEHGGGRPIAPHRSGGGIGIV
jgi:hypothetical protein